MFRSRARSATARRSVSSSPASATPGSGKTIPTEWEDAEVFLYQDEGTLRHLGRGSKALAELGYFTLRLR